MWEKNGWNSTKKPAKTWKIMEDPGRNGEKWKGNERNIEIIQFPAT